MKAAVCYKFGKPLVMEELTLRPAGPDEVKVKVAPLPTRATDTVTSLLVPLLRGRYTI